MPKSRGRTKNPPVSAKTIPSTSTFPRWRQWWPRFKILSAVVTLAVTVVGLLYKYETELPLLSYTCAIDNPILPDHPILFHGVLKNAGATAADHYHGEFSLSFVPSGQKAKPPFDNRNDSDSGRATTLTIGPKETVNFLTGKPYLVPDDATYTKLLSGYQTLFLLSKLSYRDKWFIKHTEYHCGKYMLRYLQEPNSFGACLDDEWIRPNE